MIRNNHHIKIIYQKSKIVTIHKVTLCRKTSELDRFKYSYDDILKGF